VRRLILTHFSPKIDDPIAWLENARSVFPTTDIADTSTSITLNFVDE
jgi:ribonuclease BN (tRNA processing enzyme)